MRIIPTILVALAALLASCAPVGSRELHEVALVTPERATILRYAYGDAPRMVLNERERRLGEPVGDRGAEIAFSVPAARTIDGDAFLRTTIERPFEAPLTVDRIPLSSDLRVATRAPIAQARYWDGTRWLSLGRDLAAGRTLDVPPAPASGRLRGVGDLTAAEADALADVVERGSPTVVALLPGDEVASITGASALAPRPEDGLDAYRHTALWLQRGVVVNAAAWSPPPRESVVDVVAGGERGAPPEADRFVLLRDEAALRAFWEAVHADAGSVPPLPEARFGREILLGVRLAERPTGGYGVRIEGVTREDGDLVATVRLPEPGPEDVVTQALTAPWTLVRVLGQDATAVWFRDPSGELIAVAREEDPAGF